MRLTLQRGSGTQRGGRLVPVARASNDHRYAVVTLYVERGLWSAEVLIDIKNSHAGCSDQYVSLYDPPLPVYGIDMCAAVLQGYMYLTNSHLCFFAHMPIREDKVLKSGSLNKKTQRTKRWVKHWFVLKNDVLSWYQSSSVSVPNSDFAH